MDSIDLTPEQRAVLDQLRKERVEVLAELGAAHLEYEAARVAFDKATRRTADTERKAKFVLDQEAKMVEMVAAMLKLPPGDWTYDRDKGTMVKA